MSTRSPRAHDRLFRVSMKDTLAWVVSPVAAGPLWQAPENEEPEAWLAEQVFGHAPDGSPVRVRATTFAELWDWQPRQACTVITGDAERSVLRWMEQKGALRLQRQEGLDWINCQNSDWENGITEMPLTLPATSTPTQVLVSEGWMHCFVGSRETLVRWAYDPITDRLAGQAKNGMGWETLHRDEVADLREELDDNEVLISPFGEEEAVLTSTWPTWAGVREPAPANQGTRRRRTP